MELKQFGKALITLKRIIAIKPQIPEYHFFAGLIYVRSGDTTSSQNYFKEADNCYNTILDSISKENKSFDFVLMNKAINLVCMGDKEKGNNILKQLYANEKDDIEKEVLSDFINKSRSEIVNYFLNGKQDTTTMLAGKPSKPKRIRFLRLKDNKRHKLSSGLYLLHLRKPPPLAVVMLCGLCLKFLPQRHEDTKENGKLRFPYFFAEKILCAFVSLWRSSFLT